MPFAALKLPAVALTLVAATALVGGGVAYAASSKSTVKVCVTPKQVVRSADAKGKCPKKTRSATVNVKGATGPRGATGAKGNPGVPGPVGRPGNDGAEAVALDATTPQKLTFTIGSTDNVIYDDGRLRWVTDCDYPTEPDIAAPGQVAMSSTFTATDESTLNIGQISQSGVRSSGGQALALSYFGNTKWRASGLTLTYTGSQTNLSTGEVERHIDIRGWSTSTGCTFYVRHD